MAVDQHGLEIIKAEECRRLLSQRRVAHIGLSIDALPMIIPVFYAVDGDYVVLRSRPDTPVGKALEDCVVSLAVDTLVESPDDPWGVVVTGQAERVTDEADIARMEELDIPDLIKGTVWVRIPTKVVLGRRLRTS